MTLGVTRGVALDGIDGAVVAIEVDVSSGLPAFAIGGLPDAACRQSADRVKAASANLGVSLSQCRVVVNLSPAWLPKTGSALDLGIAVATLVTRDQIAPRLVEDVVHIGELGLDGTVRPVRGVLPLVLTAVRAGYPDVVVPAANAAEAALVRGAKVVAAESLARLLARYQDLAKGDPADDPRIAPAREPAPASMRDLGDIAGQAEARAALEVAAAGGHHLFLVGPPGAGKTMLAECLPSILPPLDDEQALQVTAIHSILGALEDGALVRRPPFVAPHHDASLVALVGGGGSQIRPGLVSKAHRGVLMLDEAPEFKRGVLQSLRQPLEAGEVVVARARGSVRYPARFQLVLAANPCPCGLSFGKARNCRCRSQQKRDYLSRLSGPLLDRIDLRVVVDSVGVTDLALPRGDDSATVAQRVRQARGAQEERWVAYPWKLNSEVPGPRLREAPWRLASSAVADLDRELDLGVLTLRGYDRVLRLAWTLTDLRGGAGAPTRDDIGAALTMRGQDVAA